MAIPPTCFANADAATEFGNSMIDADAGEYFVVVLDPAGSGRAVVDLYEADGYFIARA